MTAQLPSKVRLAQIASFSKSMALPPSHDEIEAMARALLAAYEQEPVGEVIELPCSLVLDGMIHTEASTYREIRGGKKMKRMPIGTKFYTHPAPSIPALPDKMLCDFYEVSNWTDLVRELVKHVEQLQDSAKRNVKPWEDTFPATLLPAYIDRIKQADDACRAAMLSGGKS